jgi:hypothetical protein
VYVHSLVLCNIYKRLCHEDHNLSSVLTDGGKSWLIEAKARNPIQGTRGNMLHLPIPSDVTEESGQEGAVTNSRGITDHGEMLACPRNSHIDAPAVTQESHGS